MEMETTSTNQAQKNLILSVWPQCKHLTTIDPVCLAASLWLREQGHVYSMVNINRQLPLICGVYPMLYDLTNEKHYVGFESIYQHSRRGNPSADDLALVAMFKRLFIPAFMHSQWLDDTNKISFRTLYHYTIGLPTSLFHIRKRFSSAQTWVNLVTNSNSPSDERLHRIYADAKRCLEMLETQLCQANHPFICGETFSLIDAWVSGYLLVVLHHGSENCQLRSLFLQYPRLVEYIQRIDEKQNVFLTAETESQSLSSHSASDNATDMLSILHIASQVLSCSIFFFMLTKIGANSSSMKP